MGTPTRKTLDKWFKQLSERDANNSRVKTLIKKYNKELNKALEREDYLGAAKYRDLIKKQIK